MRVLRKLLSGWHGEVPPESGASQSASGDGVQPTTQQLPRRKWGLRYSLRALLIFITLFMLWGGYHTNRAWTERNAETLLRSKGVTLVYDHRRSRVSPLVWYKRVCQVVWRERFITWVGARSNITAEEIEAIASLPHLEFLGIEGYYPQEMRRWDRKPPASLPPGALVQILDRCQVRELHVHKCELSDQDFCAISHQPSLESLSFVSTNLSDEALGPILNLPRLRSLVLFDTQVTGEGLGNRPGSSSLEGISLHEGQHLSDDLAVFLSRCPRPRGIYSTNEGGADADALKGGDGQDTIAGNEGNDKIWGGSGNDTIDTGTSGVAATLEDDNAPGGPWFEIAFGEAGEDGINARSASGSAFLDGGADGDGINGSDYGDTINGGGGEDFLSGYWGPDVMSGGDDDDIMFSNNLYAGPDQPYDGLGGDPTWPDMAGTGDAGCNYVDETEEGDCEGSSGGGGGGSGGGEALMMAGGGSDGEGCGCGSGAATGGSKVSRGERMARKLGELLLKYRVFELSTDGEWRVATPVAGARQPVVTPQRERLIARLNASDWTPSAKDTDAWDGARGRRTKAGSEGDALLPVEAE